MKKYIRFAPVLVLAAFIAGCQGPCDKIDAINAPELTSGTADFTRYVAAGTSISAGYQSSGVVNRHQVTSFPALFAQQVGYTVLASGQGTFSFPAVDGNGINPLLQLRSISPPIISNSGLSPGNPINALWAHDYQNLGVPGAIAFDFGDSTRYPTNPFFALVGRHQGTIAQQMLRQGPTFISWEYGANEVLGSATAGVSTLPVPPAQYAAIVTGSMNAIHAAVPNAKLAIFNVPPVTAIPFCTTFKPYTKSLTTGLVVPLIGPSGPLDPTKDLVLLTAQGLLATGAGFPVGSYNYINPAAPGTGVGLPDAVVLSASEQDALNLAISQMNAAVDSVALRPWVVKVDLNGLLSRIATEGYTLGATHYTTAFVTGGLFSLDGVHPTDLGHALIANTMIDAVNTRFGATIPHVNPADVASTTSSAARPAIAGDDAVDAFVGLKIEGLQPALRQLFPAH